MEPGATTPEDARAGRASRLPKTCAREAAEGEEKPPPRANPRRVGNRNFLKKFLPRK